MYESHRHFVKQKKPDTTERIMCFHLSEVQEPTKSTNQQESVRKQLPLERDLREFSEVIVIPLLHPPPPQHINSFLCSLCNYFLSLLYILNLILSSDSPLAI